MLRKAYYRLRCWFFGPRIIRGQWVADPDNPVLLRFEPSEPLDIAPGESVDIPMPPFGSQ